VRENYKKSMIIEPVPHWRLWIEKKCICFLLSFLFHFLLISSSANRYNTYSAAGSGQTYCKDRNSNQVHFYLMLIAWLLGQSLLNFQEWIYTLISSTSSLGAIFLFKNSSTCWIVALRSCKWSMKRTIE